METAAAVEVLDRTRERAAEPTETRHDGNSAKRARHAVVNRVAAPGSSRPPRFFPVACEAQSRINRPEPSFEGVSPSSVAPPAPLLLPTASASSKTARKRVNTPGRMDPARKETEGSVEQSTPSSGTAQINPVPLAVQTAPVTLLTTICTTAELNERKKMLEAFERALDQRHWIRETALEKREMALERREAEPFQMAIAERETALTERDSKLDEREADLEKREAKWVAAEKKAAEQAAAEQAEKEPFERAKRRCFACLAARASDVPPGLKIAAEPPTTKQLAFSKDEDAPANALVGQSILFKWPVVGWCVGKITGRNCKANVTKTLNEGKVKVNFIVFYEIDQQSIKTVLRLDEYGGEEDMSWRLLEASGDA